ncbi:fasciclin domain-containing protein [Sanyastnella coralliicola]|uniref:fasciclin domain-containing protein n=1 Tax=Sanyastnella coralliicola TaxID=3069118 RepID=UPI0027BA0ED1|nr:fasciclin domain-containing protein [Longitalea sp. SCSIO 12813]
MKRFLYTFTLLLATISLSAQTVVNVIVDSDVHETLETAVIAAELDDDLSGEGPFTVFAPTDAAFEALPDGALDGLLADPTGALADVLLYHVHGGDLESTDLMEGALSTLLGEDVTVSFDGMMVMINDAVVTIANLPATNGVVHVIDAVLLPPAPLPATVVEIIVGSDVHETLETAVIAAELDDDLSGDGPFTVFAPTDAAFDNLPEGALDALLADPTGALADVLLYHVASGAVLSDALSDGQMIETLLGPDVEVSIDGEMVMINDAMVTIANLEADNGVVHVIDAVLLPPAPLPATVVEIIVNSDVHETLETAVIAAELDDDLSGDGPFTVFAPTDAAFDNLPEGALDALLADPTGALADVLLYHVASGAVLSDALSDGQMIETLLGPDVEVSIDGEMVMINDAMVTIANLEADNGVVHVIDAVLLPPAPLPATVVEIIVNSDVHETLETAVIAAELDDDLSGDGPFTVFAPTDEAFDNLPEGALDALLADPTGALADVLLYHVVGDAAFAADLSDGQMIETLLGPDVEVSIDGEMVMINDAMVTIADLEADNGVVHVIDAVLLPPAPLPATVVEIIVNSDVHETLETAVIAAELDDDLSGDGPFTVFAPTDEAFDNLPEGALDALLADPTGALADVLLYHVVGDAAFAADLSDGQMIETLLGPDVEVSIDGEMVMINDAMVTITDLEADNGVVHVIDAVLLPPVIPATVVDIIVESPVHETLETAVIAAELDDDLSGDGPFTVFAPTDAAFENLPDGALDDLLADPTGALADVLLYHVVGDEAFAADLSDGQMIETLLGPDVEVSIDGDVVMINDAMVTIADLEAENGVVHVIDAVLLPPAPNPATVVDIIVASEDHEILETAVIAAGLDDDLSEDGPFTVFAPTDEAFGNLPDGLLDDLLADPEGALANILLYHVAGVNALSGDLTDGQAVETLQGEDVVISITGEMVMVNDANVTTADLVADNGVVHVIDAVLTPPTSVDEVNASDIVVYPNPAQNIVNIQGVDAGSRYTVIDQAGRVVAQSTFTGANTIDVSDYEVGLYTLIISDNTTLTAKQFMVK